MIGAPEIAVVTAILLLIFGPRQIPKIGRSIGETIREFRAVGRELTSTRDDLNRVVDDVKKE